MPQNNEKPQKSKKKLIGLYNPRAFSGPEEMAKFVIEDLRKNHPGLIKDHKKSPPNKNQEYLNSSKKENTKDVPEKEEVWEIFFHPRRKKADDEKRNRENKK